MNTRWLMLVVGLLVSLALWGVIADRWGERVTLGIGLAAAGLGGASIHAASGCLILGWFAARERGRRPARALDLSGAC